MNWWESAPAVENVSAVGPPGGGGKWWESAPAVESAGNPSAGSASPKKEVPDAIQPFVGFNESVANIAGAPVDAATWGINKVARGVQALTGAERKDVITDPVGGSGTFKKAMGLVGANPDDVKPPETTTGQILRATGEGVGAAVVPAIGAEVMLARSVQAVDSFGTQLAKIIAGGGLASNTAMGAGSGAAGAVAEATVPDDASVLGVPVKPLVKFGAEVAGGGVAALADSGVRTGAAVAGRALEGLNPNVAGARKILSTTDNPQTLRGQAAELVTEGPAVPGSNPNMFQITGDKKIGELQREVATANPGRHAEVLEEQSVARTNAMNAVAPDADTASVGAFVRQRLDNIEAEYGAAVAKARQEAEAGLTGAGGTQFDNAADYGGGLQKQLDTLDRQRGAAEDRLWTAVRETAGNKAIPFGDVTKGIADLESKVGRLAEKPAGREKAIYDTIRGEGEYVTFNDIADIRSRITTALREDRELTGQARGRLRDALGIVDGALDDEVARVAADPALRTDLLQKLGMDGLTAENVAQYGAARTATRERKAAFGEGPVGDVVAGDVTPSLVVGRLLKRPEDLRAFVASAGDSPEAMALAQDALAFDMRRAAVTKDGLLSPEKLRQWQQNNAEAMRQFPDLQAKFTNARAAQESLDTAIANQKAAVEQFQSDAVKKFLADKDPHAALEQAMATPEAFRTLVAAVKEDPGALAGLKRLAVELIMRKGGVSAEGGALAGAKEAGTSESPQLAANAVQKFVINRRAMLGEIFDKAELANIEAVTKDMQRAARSIKIPDSSGTPQDTRAMMMSVLGGFLKNVGTGATGGAMIDPIFGTAAGAAGGFLKTVYQGRVDRAVADMMLDPRKFAAWAPKVGEAAASEITLARKMRALLGQEALQSLEMETEQRSP